MVVFASALCYLEQVGFEVRFACARNNLVSEADVAFIFQDQQGCKAVSCKTSLEWLSTYSSFMHVWPMALILDFVLVRLDLRPGRA